MAATGAVVDPLPAYSWAQERVVVIVATVTAAAAMKSDLIFGIALTPIQDLLDLRRLTRLTRSAVLLRNYGETKVEDRKTFAGPLSGGAVCCIGAIVQYAQPATELLSVNWQFGY